MGPSAEPRASSISHCGHGYIDEVVKTDSPLRHALSVGVKIIAIDGEDTSALSHEEIVRRVGEKRDVEKFLDVRHCFASAHGHPLEEVRAACLLAKRSPPPYDMALPARRSPRR